MQVNEREKLKDDHNLGKCQHGKKKVAERKLIHIATKHEAQ